MKHSKGFTLIELLVVIAIISVLATIIFSSLSDVRAQAHDAQRHRDIRTIQTALEMYYLDHGRYPYQNWLGVTPDSSWATLETEMGVRLPRDPVNFAPIAVTDWAAGTNKRFNYAYVAWVPGCTPHGQGYYIVYRLEKGDAVGDERKGIRNCNGTMYYRPNGVITTGMIPMM